MSNFIMIEEHHTKKFIQLISPHVPKNLQQNLHHLTAGKIALDRSKHEIHAQQLLRGLKKSTLYLSDKQFPRDDMAVVVG